MVQKDDQEDGDTSIQKYVYITIALDRVMCMYARSCREGEVNRYNQAITRLPITEKLTTCITPNALAILYVNGKTSTESNLNTMITSAHP